MSSTAPDASGDVVYAGFLRRWAALFLDQLILTGAFYLVAFIFLLAAGFSSGFGDLNAENPPPWLIGAYFGAIGFYYLIAALYYGLMESSSAQATVGKMALGIKVTDADGRRLTLPHALGRWFAAALSYLTFYIGFIVAAFTERKQALHDLVARTLVVDKWAFTDTPERQQRGLSGCLIAFLVVMVGMVMISVLGILAAIAIPAYQDYTQRARITQVINAAAGAKALVQERYRLDDECPDNDSQGFAAPESYAGGDIRSIDFETLEDGACAIVVTLADLPVHGAGHRIVFDLDSRGERWTCESTLPDRQLPASCR